MAAGRVAEGSGNVIVVPRSDSGGRLAGYAVVNLVESRQKTTLPSDGLDLLSGRRCGPTLTLDPLAVRLIRTR